MMKYTFEVNGFTVNADYCEDEIDTIFIPLLKRFTKLQKQCNRRIFVFLSAIPGCGKTTLSLFLEYLSKQNDEYTNIQAIGMDGFHYPNTYLKMHYMQENGNEVRLIDRKGSYASFDVEKLQAKILEGKQCDNIWPIYSRKIHDVIQDKMPVKEKIILLEGNYLLLNDYGWQHMIDYCDDSIFIDTDEYEVKERLIARKMQGGLTEEEAIHFYDNSDYKNVMLLMHHHHKANIELIMKEHRLFKKEGTTI